MLKKRIIPCLDIKDGRTVKGVNFEGLRDAGNPVELARKYANEGADELVFLDITATIERRRTLFDLVVQVAKEINIPFTVGGGISSVDEAVELVRNGADKISLNSSAVKEPSLIRKIADKLGSQCVVVAVDTKFVNGNWKVFVSGGRIETDWTTVEWVKKVAELGAGEILLTSMNSDGTKNGFELDILKEVTDAVSIPVVASGGAGKMEHFKDVFQKTSVGAALAASVFHYGEISIPDLKAYLGEEGIVVRNG